MNSKSYREATSRLGGLTLDELKQLRGLIDDLIASESKQDDHSEEKKTRGYKEKKLITKKDSDGKVIATNGPYWYWRHWDKESGKLKSTYLGKVA